MKKLRRLLFRLLFLVLLVFAVIFAVNTMSFSSQQITVEPVDPLDIDDAVVERLAQAVRIPTVSEEGRIDTAAFRLLDTFLWRSFPLVDSMLEKQRVNEFSYLLRWPGQNSRLAPILLMAHLDVVPVENGGDRWTVPPFAGLIGGQAGTAKDGYLWGRGTLDDKLSVLGILEAVESLLSVDWAPQRTVYLAFGHDEEIGGEQGAKAIAEILAKQKLEFEFVLDEGSIIVEQALPGCDPPVALIGVAEKGYATFDLTVNSDEGGHSSMPKPGSAINLLTEAIVRLKENPSPAKIDGPVREMFRHVGPEMGFFQKIIFANLRWTEGLVIGQLEQSPTTNALVRTTAAPTILRSGFKDNVIPTEATAVVNCRILPGESVASTQAYLQDVVGKQVQVSLSKEGHASEPPPISGQGTFGYSVLQTTIRQVYPEVIVAPNIVVATTDSRHMTGLSENIYRFLPVQVLRSEIGGIHGLDEKIKVEQYRQTVRWYRQLFLNACK